MNHYTLQEMATSSDELAQIEEEQRIAVEEMKAAYEQFEKSYKEAYEPLYIEDVKQYEEDRYQNVATQYEAMQHDLVMEY